MNNIPDWNQEWNQIKGHMMALLKPQMNLNLLAPRQRLALEYLEREGVESKVILDLFQQLRGDKSKAILPELEKNSSGPCHEFQQLAPEISSPRRTARRR
ncbi:hypothetical protein [Maridesulfovibrio sp.]|uniref:hypothetical protein n=1 Tax=Maridesulfovibrio sp. TaxID=2795000 RepID=UPI0039F143EE